MSKWKNLDLYGGRRRCPLDLPQISTLLEMHTHDTSEKLKSKTILSAKYHNYFNSGTCKEIRIIMDGTVNIYEDPVLCIFTESKHIYFQYSDARQEKRLLCAQNCTMTSCYVTSRHVVVYFQLAMLSALLDLFFNLWRESSTQWSVNNSGPKLVFVEMKIFPVRQWNPHEFVTLDSNNANNNANW